jgi:Ca2+-binding EF-hand superfamily protein
MKAIKLTLLAGAAIAAAGVAVAQPPAPRGPAPEVTREQAVQRADQHFQQLDADRDGRVTAAELQARAQGRMGQRQQRMAQRQGRMADRQGQMFDRLDTDRNGQISREEFGQRMAMRGGGEGRRGMRGQRGGMGGGGRMGERLLGEDGVVTAEEFRTRALERFDRMDANHDGRIAPEERRGGRGRRGGPAPATQQD